MGLAARTGHRRTRPGPSEPALRRARVCYDHLAGEMGVAMLDGLLARGVVEGCECPAGCPSCVGPTPAELDVRTAVRRLLTLAAGSAPS